jgi:hypothetical protein
MEENDEAPDQWQSTNSRSYAFTAASTLLIAAYANRSLTGARCRSDFQTFITCVNGQESSETAEFTSKAQ